MSEMPNGFKKIPYSLARAAFFHLSAYVAQKVILHNRMKWNYLSWLHVIHRVLHNVPWYLWNWCLLFCYVFIYAFFYNVLIIFCWTSQDQLLNITRPSVYSNFAYFISCPKYVFRENIIISPKWKAKALDKTYYNSL